MLPELNVEKNSRQMPNTINICASKKYYDILYAYLQCISEKDGEERYVNKK